MLRILFCLMFIITVVYSDCCTKDETTINEGECDADDTMECHLKHYGIYCCNKNVETAMGSYADISSKIVRLHCTMLLLLLCMHLYLQLGFIKDHNDTEFVSDLDVSSKTIEYLLQNFTSKCKRYTKVMATKHLLQYHMFNNPDQISHELTQAVMYLETAAYRLQHIQVSTFIHSYKHTIYVLFAICRSYMVKDLVWSLQQNNTSASTSIDMT